MGFDVKDIQAAHITDVSTQDLTGGATIDLTKTETDLAALRTAVNSIILALENIGVLAKS